MPTTEEVEEIRAWIDSHPDSEQLAGYRLGGGFDDDLTDWVTYCRRHAREAAMKYNHAHDLDDDEFCAGHAFEVRLDEGDDRPVRCETCDAPLDVGGLFDSGVGPELGLDEADPLAAVRVDLATLTLLRDTLDDTDPRLRLWMWHARRAREATIDRDIEIEQLAARIVAEAVSKVVTRKRSRVWAALFADGWSASRLGGPMPYGTEARAGWLAYVIANTVEDEEEAEET